MLNKKNNQKGFAAFYLTVLILAVVFTIGASISILIYGQEKISRNIVRSSQAYYTAEAGIEDSIYRIIKGKKYEATNIVQVGTQGTATINITSQDNTRIIKSAGQISQTVRTLESILSIDSGFVSFHYGAQIDKGGLYIGSGASVQGNIYSNGNIIGQGSNSKITGDVWVAGAVAPEPDQQWTDQDSDFPFGLKIDEEYYLDTAQSFIPSTSAILNIVSFYIKKNGSPSDQTIRILTNDVNQPSKIPLASATLKSSKVTTNYSWIDVSLDTPPNLTAGAIYWIMIDVSKDKDNYWVWGRDSTDSYLSGTGKYAENWDEKYPVWKDVGGDLNFKTWMGGETPTYIDKIWVGEDAYANTITNSFIYGDAYYQIIDGTTVEGIQYPDSPDPSNEDLPISYSQIQDWEKEACCDTGDGCKSECIYIGDLELIEGDSIGPMKIEGNLTFPSNSNDNPVIIIGPVWVTGEILASNNATIKLKDGLEYGYTIIADNPSDQINGGKINFNNNVITQDSDEGGKLLFISTNKSTDFVDPAIHLYHNVNKDAAQSIIFSLYGLIRVENNTKFKEITGYALNLDNNAEIVYEEGLINSNFSSGPGGGWKVISWAETY